MAKIELTAEQKMTELMKRYNSGSLTDEMKERLEKAMTKVDPTTEIQKQISGAMHKAKTLAKDEAKGILKAKGLPVNAKNMEGAFDAVFRGQRAAVKKAEKLAAEKLAKEVAKKSTKSISKAALSILGKGARAAGKLGLKGVTGGALEVFDAESLGNPDITSTERMLEGGQIGMRNMPEYSNDGLAPEFSFLKSKEDLESEGIINSQLEPSSFTSLQEASIGLPVALEDAKVNALRRSIASVEDKQNSSILDKLGQRPTQDIVGDESPEMDEVKDQMFKQRRY